VTSIQLLERALDQTGVIVDGVKEDQLDAPTPCGDWNVRTVIAHLVRGNQNTAGMAEGKPRQADPIADVGDDPKGAYRSSAEAVKTAWRDEALLDQDFQSPLGPLSGREYLAFRLSENMTHGWDLARATGQPPRYDDEAVQAALVFVQTRLGTNRPQGGPFGGAVSVPDDLPAIDRLAAFLGRTP
jgi:uncharacterized protein (TIGR03086 family)